MTSTDTAAARRRERAAQGTTSTTVVGALVLEVDDLRERVNSHDRVLSPAFSPRREDGIMSTRGPGAYPAEPVVMRQASSRSDPWAGDYEHSPEFLDDLRNGANIAELRRRSARDVVMGHQASQPSPVLFESRAWCGQNGCRPASPCMSCHGHRAVVRDSSAAPVQASRPFPGEQAADSVPEQVPPVRWDVLPEPAGTEPGFMAARQHVLPQRPPGEGGQVVRGL